MVQHGRCHRRPGGAMVTRQGGVRTRMFGDGPDGRYAGGLYRIEDRDATMPKSIADDICRLTDRLLAERDITQAAFEWRINQIKRKRDA